MKTKKLVLMAMFTALYVVLSLYGTIRIGNSMKITVDGLPIILGALMFGPVSGMIIGLMGSFLSQLLTYGITATTVLWVIPAGVRGLVVGAYAHRGRRMDRLKSEAEPWEKKNAHAANQDGVNLPPKNLTFILVLSALLVTACNTLALYLDSVIYGYFSFAVVVAPIPMRIVTGIVTAFVYVAVTYPLLNLLKRAVPELNSSHGG